MTFVFWKSGHLRVMILFIMNDVYKKKTKMIISYLRYRVVDTTTYCSSISDL